MERPRIVVNAKVYSQVQGTDRVLDLARACQTAAEESGAVIGLAPPQIELAALTRACRNEDLTRVPVFAQHTDALVPGSGTGWITPEAVHATSALGSLLNHAEHKIPHTQVATTIERLHSLGLESLVCADGPSETDALAPMAPTYLAVEPPELIGGDISVTSSDPGIVSNTVARVQELSPATLTLCGAGVKTGRDVSTAIELGAYGVLLASGVVKHTDPLAALRDLCAGL